MTRLLITILFGVLLGPQLSEAQTIQQSYSSGAEKMVVQSSLLHSIDHYSKLTLSSQAFYNKFYDPANEKFDEAVIKTSVTRRFGSHFSTGPDLFYSSAAGLQPGMLLSYHRQLLGFQLRFISKVAYNVPSNALQGNLSLILQKSYPLTSQWSIAGKALLVGSWLKFQTHDRSIVQVRLGPVYRKQFQFGLAYDIDRYGPDKLGKSQFGLFIRKQF